MLKYPPLTKAGKIKADQAVGFIETHCTHFKGKWAGKPFKLIKSWQLPLVREIFGRLRPDGFRQYRFVYLEIPKKNGKTELGSAIALLLLCGDGEEGAEVYSAAGDKDQAGLIYVPAKHMVENDDDLKGRLTVIDSQKRIVDYRSNSFYRVLSAEAFTKHGISPSGVLFDETHAQPNRDLWDVLTEGTDFARDQQLVLVMTTAGEHDEESIGWELHEYALKVRDGIIEDKTFLPLIFACDEGDNWEDEELWRKLNPSLGHIFDMDKIRRDYTKAKNNPASAHNFKRFRLNMWLENISAWLPMDDWDKCNGKVDYDSLKGRKCYGGLDLSTKIDMTSFGLVFPPETKGEKVKVLIWYYCPKERILAAMKRDKVNYLAWEDAGHLTAIPGKKIDYGYIKKDILQADKDFQLKEVAYDPWNAYTTALELENQEDIVMVEHRQGWKSMSEPTKELHALVISHGLAHNKHPILRWNASNLKVKIDESENVRPVKGKTIKRIDGIVVLIMGVGRMNADVDEDEGNDGSLLNL